MKKGRLQKDFHLRNSLVPIFLTIVVLFYAGGCTTKALNYAKAKAEFTPTRFINIKNIRAAHKQENGDILLCVSFADGGRQGEQEESYTIVLPISSLAKGDADKNAQGFIERSEINYWYSYSSIWKFYDYPIEKAQKGCDKIFSEKFSTAKYPILIEDIYVHETINHADYFDTQKKFAKKLSKEEKIYIVRVRFSPLEQSTKIASDSSEMIIEKAIEPLIHLIYWPSQTMQEQEGINPIGIVGGYQLEHKGNNWGYLLVPPAFALDLIFILLYAAGHAPM